MTKVHMQTHQTAAAAATDTASDTAPVDDSRINIDYTARVVIDTGLLPWVASPRAGVTRRILERDGGEVARATSVVRHAAHSHFDQHTHDEGEEIFVLDGVFADEHGEYRAGTYLRNPPGSVHAPFSATGCTLFVKLRYFDQADQQRVAIDTQSQKWHQGLVPGLTVMPLHEHKGSGTALVRWAPNTYFQAHQHWGGEEIYVIDGEFADEHGRYPAGSWLRSPHKSRHTPFSQLGCTILVKTGHLPA
jgi:anti-sigma factor ChrR (cupin superfamily)